MKFLYFDCFGGFDNEMIIGALIDMGANPSYIEDLLNQNGFKAQIGTQRVIRSEISACEVMLTVDCDDDILNFKEVESYIDANIKTAVKKRVADAFLRIADARAKTAGKERIKTTYSQKHIFTKLAKLFAAFTALDIMGADKVICSAVHEGIGLRHKDNFVCPIPKPSTAEIIKDINMPTVPVDISEEFISEDGAAFAACAVNSFGKCESANVINTGFGAGPREAGLPDIIKATLCETEEFNLEIIERELEGELVMNI